MITLGWRFDFLTFCLPYDIISTYLKDDSGNCAVKVLYEHDFRCIDGVFRNFGWIDSVILPRIVFMLDYAFNHAFLHCFGLPDVS